MNRLATILNRIGQKLAFPVDRRSSQTGKPDPKTAEHRTRDDDFFVMTRLLLNVILLYIISFASTVDHLRTFEQLLNVFSIMSCCFGCLLREKWSPHILNRWDEAVFLATLSMGLRLFA